jgi:hypothetical protein
MPSIAAASQESGLKQGSDLLNVTLNIPLRIAVQDVLIYWRLTS